VENLSSAAAKTQESIRALQATNAQLTAALAAKDQDAVKLNGQLEELRRQVDLLKEKVANATRENAEKQILAPIKSRDFVELESELNNKRRVIQKIITLSSDTVLCDLADKFAAKCEASVQHQVYECLEKGQRGQEDPHCGRHGGP
jgi:hypothetical protein